MNSPGPLNTRLIGRASNSLHRLPVTGSTNADALKRASEGGQEGEIFIADEQTSGRGQLDRKWESPARKNLYISFLLRPKLSPSESLLLTLVAGVSVHETLLEFLPPPLRGSLKIKWPNDVYLDDKKIAGILTEMGSESGQARWAVVGMGMNVNADAEDFSPKVRGTATSLKIALGESIDREDFTQKLIETFDREYLSFCEKGPEAFFDFYKSHSYLDGRRVRVKNGPEEILEGTAAGLDTKGFLLVKTDAGKVSVISGDVVLEKI